MKPKVNIFGQRICIKNECPAWLASESSGSFCQAKLDFSGTTCIIDGVRQGGVLCTLPVEFDLIKRAEFVISRKDE